MPALFSQGSDQSRGEIVYSRVGRASLSCSLSLTRAWAGSHSFLASVSLSKAAKSLCPSRCPWPFKAFRSSSVFCPAEYGVGSVARVCCVGRPRHVVDFCLDVVEGKGCELPCLRREVSLSRCSFSFLTYVSVKGTGILLLCSILLASVS